MGKLDCGPSTRYRACVLAELHGSHPGISRMKSITRMFVWWHGVDKNIEELVKECNECNLNRASLPKATLQPWKWPTRPWARVHLDYAGPVGGKMFLVIIDAHSKWMP